MPRQRSQLFEPGKITVRPHPTQADQLQARAYYRGHNDKRTEVTASGKSETAAIHNLKSKIKAAKKLPKDNGHFLRHDTNLGDAARFWLEWKERQGDVSVRTLRDYRGYIKNSIKGSHIAKLSLMDVNDVGQIESWLEEIADSRGGTAAIQSRKVLSGILSEAERRGVIPSNAMRRVRTPKPRAGSNGDNRCTNKTCDYLCGKRHLDTKRAFTAGELRTIQELADQSSADVGDLTAFLFATGARFAEALHHTHWADVDLTAQTVHIRGTKTEQSDRTLTISDDLTARLQRRAELHGTEGLVFGITRNYSKRGKRRDLDNVRKILTRVFASAGTNWANTHTFRRTVATWMDDQGASLAEIANQLGHADVMVTAGYLGRRSTPTRAASIMVLPK